MSRTNKATQRSAPPMKKGAQRQNNSSKKTSRNQLEGARQRSSGIGRQTSVASAYSSSSVTNPPIIRQSGDTCRIVHRELLTSVSGSQAFTIRARYALNPGISATFPWLSRISVCWEQYKFHKLRFVYLTRTGSTTPGSMMLAPDYDAADAAPANEQVASSYRGVIEDAPWKNITCVLNQKDLNSSNGYRYVRSRILEPNLDIKTYDAGIMNLITLDGVDGTGWGKLWVEYDVEFKIPHLPDVFPTDTVFAGPSDPVTVSNTRPLGSLPVIQQAGEVITSISNDASEQTINFSKDFHGILNYYLNSTVPNQLAGKSLVMNPTLGMQVNEVEGLFRGTADGVNNPGTKLFLTTLVSALAGSKLGIKLNSALVGPIGDFGFSQLSLTPCGL